LPTERHLRLNDSRLKASEMAHPIKPAGLLQGEAMKLQYLFKQQMPNHASRRYSSAFFWSKYSEAF
jgi:hypothetical protein